MRWIVALAAFQVALPVLAEEGKWTPQQVLEQGPGWVKARFKAKEAQQKRLVAQCEAKPATRCQFAEFDGGLFFTLTEFEEITLLDRRRDEGA